jgi:hypothetical protein
MTVQVVSVTHKLNDGQGSATALEQPICYTPSPKVRSGQIFNANHDLVAGSPPSGNVAAGPTSKDPISNGVTSDHPIGANSAGPALVPSKPNGRKLGKIPHESGGRATKVMSTILHEPGSSSLDTTLAEIIQLWRMRQRWHRAEKALVMQGKAICRSWCGGDKDEAAQIFEDVQEHGSLNHPELQIALMPFVEAIDRFKREREALEKQLRKLAEKLPVWADWAEGVKGFGALRLSAIVGEAGDIGSYRNPSCLWKRMGLAVIRGERQRRASEAELALEMGYSPERRCIAYLLGQEIMRGAGRAEDKRYREIYDRRREYEFPRCEALRDIMQKKFGKYSPKAHAHNRAMRYLTKRVLRDLWCAWRRTPSMVSSPH